MKWDFTAKAQGDQKFVACNADEGDPGAFMDRSHIWRATLTVLSRQWLLPAYAVGANQGLYLYPRRVSYCGSPLEYCDRSRRENTDFWAKIFSVRTLTLTLKFVSGAGAFVCGEETALLTSIEGNRGEPRPRPPFPAVKGLLDEADLAQQR